MKLLLAHNHYQNSGGEDQVFRLEAALLRKHGHDVILFEDNNVRISSMSPIVAAINTIWSRASYDAIRRTIQSSRPDIAHFHNTFLMISPAAYYACRDEGVPVVQTLHNFRLLCPAATLYRDGMVCEECSGKFFALPGVTHACYRNSKIYTAGSASMVTAHKIMGTWKKLVNVYIALTDFARQKFVEGGLPVSRIVVKPNFVAPDPGMGNDSGGFALYVGRLSDEKGILTMLKAWKNVPFLLKIAGDGPLRDNVLNLIAGELSNRVEYLGPVSHDQVISLMKNACFLIFPSEWYEGFPMVLAEAFACGLPVISSALGGMKEIVEDKVTGMLFAYGNADDLAGKVLWAIRHPFELVQMRLNARNIYLQKYSEESAYENILEVYNHIMPQR